MSGFEYSDDRTDVVETGHDHTLLSVTTTRQEVKVDTNRSASRQIVYLYNHSTTDTIYWGGPAVTTSGAKKGVPVAPGQFASLPWGDLPLYVISDNASGVPVTAGEVG
jgi:hypothetical protein